MPIDSPNLDDRSFHELLLEAKAHVARTCPEWTDLSPHDPGTVLLEAFAHMTEVMLYRLNRLPEKAYVELLRLIGLQLQPPTAAVARLELRLAREASAEVEIPRGLRVTAGGGSEAPVFTVARRAVVPAGEQTAEALAYHAEWVEAESVGRSTGQPGQTVRVQRPPIVAPTSADLEVFVGVEIRDDEEAGRVPSVAIDGRPFRVWREVETFADQRPDAHVFRVDRVDGTIHFPPAVRRLEPLQEGEQEGQAHEERLSPVPRPLGAVPPAGREIVVSYWCGGGAAGNVQADVLTTLKDGLAGGGATVRNPAPARGGRDQETVDNALRRGPLELFTLERAVTAQDYESLARRNGGVSRARAFTSRELWAHADPGAVEVVLVPRLAQPERATLEALHQGHSDEVRTQVQAVLDERRPAGTSCTVTWARYKRVRVQGDVFVHRAERIPELRERIARRLHRTINPLPVPPQGEGWRFGQPLKASHAYDAILAEPGVVYAERVRFVVDEVPDAAVRSIAGDGVQHGTWYAGSGARVFRSQNDAESWELVHDAGEGAVGSVASHPDPEHAGLVAVAVNVSGDAPRARIMLSRDGGETWAARATLERHEANDLAWTTLERAPVLLVATGQGLYRIFVNSDAGPDLMVVDPNEHDRGIESVAVAETARQERFVAAAMTGVGGVFLSEPGAGSFRPVGLDDEDVRVVRTQHDGLRTFLWAGVSAIGDTPGTGCHVMELVADPAARRWVRVGRAWAGGTCHDIAFEGALVHAASHRAGVLTIDAARDREGAWTTTDVNAGLPLEARQGSVFHPVRAVAARATSPRLENDRPVLLAGGPKGVFRSLDSARTFQSRAEPVFTESVTLPETWLFCSGEHELEVHPEGGRP